MLAFISYQYDNLWSMTKKQVTSTPQWIIPAGVAILLLVVLSFAIFHKKLTALSHITMIPTPTIIPLPTQSPLLCVAPSVDTNNKKTYDCSKFTIQVPSDWTEEQAAQDIVTFSNAASKTPVSGSPDYQYPRDKGKISVRVRYDKTTLSAPAYIQQFDDSQRKTGLTIEGTNTPCTLRTYTCIERKYKLYGAYNYEYVVQNPQKNVIVTLSAGLDYQDYLPLIQAIFVTFKFR